jgi:hypothetical protein
MAQGPQRRAEPVRHLNAHIAPVERALIARAKAIEEQAATAPEGPDGELLQAIMEAVAGEFRKLADELHHW